MIDGQAASGRSTDGPGGWATRVFIADRGDAGVRIDRAVLRHLPDVPAASRARVQRWIGAGHVLVDGQAVRRVSVRLRHGQRVEVTHPVPAPRSPPSRVPIDLCVLYEDARVLALDKPAGLVVHPTYRHASGTVLDALAWRARPGGWVPRLLHRLDKDTSGVLLVAKDLEAFRLIGRAWGTPLVRKDYLAVVVGRPASRDGDVRAKIGRDPLDRRRVVVSPVAGEPSCTRYRLLAASRGHLAGLSLLLCTLITGRTHQVRVHLASMGCPIAGDRVYGARRVPGAASAALRAVLAGVAHQALHAWRLVVPHPDRSDPLVLTAPVPADMQHLIATAGLAPALDRLTTRRDYGQP